MPTVPAAPPHDRFFARLERFQCECPSCGRLLTSTQDQGHLAANLITRGRSRVRSPKKHSHGERKARTAADLVWNPVTQRLICPWCKTAFVVGLLLFPVQPGPKVGDAPPDAVVTRRERLEQRRIAEGYYVETPYVAGQHVNHNVTASCSCPPKGWASDCLIHGTPPPAPASSALPKDGV